MDGDMSDPRFWDTHGELIITKWFFEVYMKTYCRMTPYLTGMYAALVHHKDDGSFHERQYILVEWLAFAVMIVIGCCAMWPFNSASDGYPNWIYMNTSRQVYGLCLSYLVAMIVTARSDVSKLRPSGFMRCFLSFSFWVPWAVISYSFYCFSLPMMY